MREKRVRRKKTAEIEEVGEAPGQRVVFYRCPTPTNFLCPCGAVERRLKKLGVHHRIERVPYSKRNRPEIEELTKQRRVPVLVYGSEIITDSKRILQFLQHEHSEPDPVEKPPRKQARRSRLKGRKSKPGKAAVEPE